MKLLRCDVWKGGRGSVGGATAAAAAAATATAAAAAAACLSSPFPAGSAGLSPL